MKSLVDRLVDVVAKSANGCEKDLAQRFEALLLAESEGKSFQISMNDFAVSSLAERLMEAVAEWRQGGKSDRVLLQWLLRNELEVFVEKAKPLPHEHYKPLVCTSFDLSMLSAALTLSIVSCNSVSETLIQICKVLRDFRRGLSQVEVDTVAQHHEEHRKRGLAPEGMELYINADGHAYFARSSLAHGT